MASDELKRAVETLGSVVGGSDKVRARLLANEPDDQYEAAITTLALAGLDAYEREAAPSDAEIEAWEESFHDAMFDLSGDLWALRDDLKPEGLREKYESMRSRVREAVALMRRARQWQPIETAPRDGTEVVVLTHHGNPHIAECSDGAWLVEDGDGWMRVHATHWMPLPAAPKDASDGQ